MWLAGVVVRRYIDFLIIIINFPYSTCISFLGGGSIPTSLFIIKYFFVLTIIGETFTCKRFPTIITYFVTTLRWQNERQMFLKVLACKILTQLLLGPKYIQ